eukprot:COSAG01_NODE_20225_length_964_cov_4.752601_1_plen_153_part_00
MVNQMNDICVSQNVTHKKRSRTQKLVDFRVENGHLWSLVTFILRHSTSATLARNVLCETLAPKLVTGGKTVSHTRKGWRKRSPHTGCMDRPQKGAPGRPQGQHAGLGHGDRGVSTRRLNLIPRSGYPAESLWLCIRISAPESAGFRSAWPLC